MNIINDAFKALAVEQLQKWCFEYPMSLQVHSELMMQIIEAAYILRDLKRPPNLYFIKALTGINHYTQLQRPQAIQAILEFKRTLTK